METIPVPEENATNANPSSVKSDDSSPRAESGRGSPPPNCAICLGTCKNKSFTDSCLHQFCFSCLLTWSKVKAECPLCKQNFRSIIHNVRSNHQYEEYLVEQRHTEENIDLDAISIDSINNATRRFRYRTTLTLPRRESVAIEQLLLHYPLVPGLYGRAPPTRRRRSPTSFRRTVYRHNLWARPLPDFTGRFRDCSPEFYTCNPAQMHRLVPWLNRELLYLLSENIAQISYVLSRILELLPQHHITSPEFREALHYFGDRTEHFLHELYCFASTPYDMTGYDRYVQYTTDPRISTLVNEVISSSDTEASVDSDIVMVSSSAPIAGPSRPPEPAYNIPNNSNNVIPIETISHSDTDDESVMVVGYIKPPQDRTPEVVDLLGSDSDVVVQDTPAPGPSSNEVVERNVPLVKLSLKRHDRWSNDSSDSENDLDNRVNKIRKNRRRSSSALWRPAIGGYTSVNSSSSSTTSSVSSFVTNTTSSSDTDSSHHSRQRKQRKKKKLKSSSSKSKSKRRKIKPQSDEESRSKSKSKKEKRNQSTQTQRKEKHKSSLSKETKNSKRSESSNTPPIDHNQPSTSGTSSTSHKDKTSSGKKKDKQTNREFKKRLKSVVKVINSQQSEKNGCTNLLDIVKNAIINPNSNVLAYNSDSGSIPSDERTRTVDEVVPTELIEKAEYCFNVGSSSIPNTSTQNDDTDSEDNLPLNLTMKRM